MLSDHNLQSIPRDALKANIEDSFAKELEMMLHEQRRKEIIDMDRDIMNIYRSGSAPPTVDGSLTAMRSLFGNSSYVDYPAWMNRSGINGSISEEDIRFLHENLNPKVAQPLSPQEDWHQKFQVGNSDSSKSLFSSQPGQFPQTREANLMDPRMITPRNLARQSSAEWMEKDADNSNRLDVAGLPTRAKSLVDIRQDDPGLLPRPMSCNAVENGLDSLGSRHPQPTQLPNRMKSLDDMYSLETAPDLVRDQSPHSSGSSSATCLSQNTASEATRIGRSPAHYLHEEGIVGTTEKKNISISKTLKSFPSRMTNGDLAATLSGLSLSENRLAEQESQIPHQFQELDTQPTFLHSMLNGHGNTPKRHFADQSEDAMRNTAADNDMTKNIGSMGYLGVSPDFLDFPGRTDHLYSGVHAASLQRSSGHYQDVGGPKFGSFMDGYSLSQRPNGVMDDSPTAGTVLRHNLEGSNMGRIENQVDYGLRLRGDPLFVQNLQKTCGHHARSMQGLNGPGLGIDYSGTSDADFLGFQKAYLGALLAQQKQLYEMSALGNSASYGNGYYGNHAYCLSTTLPGARIPSPRRPIWQNEQIPCYPSRIRSSMSGSPGSWHLNNGGITGESSPPSLLEELKNNKARSLELSEIVDHVVKFSADQYGSRFIQQKLETATAEEKNKLFQEIMPHALTLMTDVFGNYVIQKFFEHGTEAHRKELASQISGHVLPLSLQMYGCRVIQKALEMVDVDRQAQLVAELDGSVMKCIRDQNGNHVIQKCIECVPQDRIQFIISSFYGQVVALSTHPYGCRVIQRVLEHCDDANTQKIVMEEILQSACNLAQDQYGNYVVQHVLQHGKPQERSAIISELAGQIVKMSQQKFASNVVEKCLTFGGPEERQLLVNEMLGSTDENEPLQAMMKDPFANYVVQKLLETCDSRSRDLILSRIKVHLNALKRYTYGKHIVARVEKLINTEERRIGISSSSYSF